MSDRTKLYLVSILGISKRPDVPGEKPVSRYVHVPLLVDAECIDDAEDAACVEANKLFPPDLGFQTRHIAVKPIPPEEYIRFLQLANEGKLATNEEPAEQAVHFLCSLDDPEETWIEEFNKLIS